MKTPRSTAKLAKLLLATSLLSGCSPEPGKLTEVQFYQLYCAVEEQRRFSHEEWAWRQANAKWNLDKDVAVNNRRSYGGNELAVELCKD